MQKVPWWDYSKRRSFSDSEFLQQTLAKAQVLVGPGVNEQAHRQVDFEDGSTGNGSDLVKTSWSISVSRYLKRDKLFKCRSDERNETGLSTKGIQNLAPKFWNTEQKKISRPKRAASLFFIAITLWSHRLKGFCNLSCFPGSGVVLLLLRDLFWSPPSSPLRRRSRRSAPRRVSRACRRSGTSRWIARPTHGPGKN